MLGDVDADLVHDRDGEAVERAGPHARRIDDRSAGRAECFISASAIGERTAFSVQAEQDAAREARATLAHAPDVQDADQREQAPRGVEVELDLAGQALAQQLGAFVVQAAAAHVDGLDLRRAGRCGSPGSSSRRR